MTCPRVLIPHAKSRAALSVIRSLGRHGCEVIASGPSTWCLGCRSRYARLRVKHPDPSLDARGFAEAVAASARALDIGAILPVSDIAMHVLIENRALLPRGVRLVVPPPEALRVAHDKLLLVELAARIGVPVPRWTVPGVAGTWADLAEELGYPVVIKPRRSIYSNGGRWRKATVAVVGSQEDLREALRCRPELLECGLLLQEKVPGEGRGIFLLACEGEVRCVFAHRRIRENPPWGGVSTLCEATHPEPTLVEYSARLMKALGWTGVAMIEFKWDPLRKAGWLIEINGRFWGSLELAIASGVDFPWYLYCEQVIGRPAVIPASHSPARLWWLLGDAGHFMKRLRTEGVRAVPAMVRDLVHTRDGSKLRLDTFQRDDPLPFVAECVEKVWGGPGGE